MSKTDRKHRSASSRARTGPGAAAPRLRKQRQAPQALAASRLQQVQQVLDEVLKWRHPAEGVLSRWIKSNPKLGSRDRVELADGVFNVVRHLRRYRHFAQSGSGPETRRLAILGLSATMGVEWVAEALSADERVWLDRVMGIDPQSLSPEVRWSLPDWLFKRLNELDQPEALAQALIESAPLDLRVNTIKADREEVLRILHETEIAPDAQPTPYSPWGIRLQGRPPVHRWSMFERGEIEVQDEGSQILTALMAPKRGEMVIDYCAGAGGKTMLLGALMRSTGRLYAFDVSAARLARAKPRFARSGLSNIVPVVINPDNDQRVRRLRGKAHRVLVDAPCSGLGTLRRSPDLKWRQNPESLQEFQSLQARILQQAASCVMDGGRLVYATCSLLPEENQQQVDRFLAANPSFELLDAAEIVTDRCKNLVTTGPFLSLRPDIHGTDGFFAAVLQRS